MKLNTLILNKKVEEHTTSFTVWTEGIFEISHFISLVTSVKGIPSKLNFEKDTKNGHHVNIRVLSVEFNDVIKNIQKKFKKHMFVRLKIDFERKEWSKGMTI